jgi:hypothetical protein
MTSQNQTFGCALCRYFHQLTEESGRKAVHGECRRTAPLAVDYDRNAIWAVTHLSDYCAEGRRREQSSGGGT